MGIETICQGGTGGEASVFIQLRNTFQGLGGLVRTDQEVVVAYRQNHGGLAIDEIALETPPSPTLESSRSQEAARVYLRHMLVKKFDDLFFRKGTYSYAHIPRPLGFTDDAYLYEWTFGSEGFPTEFITDDFCSIPVIVDEWIAASNAFVKTGIYLATDTSDADDGRYAKNIIVTEQNPPSVAEKRSKLWKRIDFGTNSLRMDYDLLFKYLAENEQQLISYLKPERVELMKLATQFLRMREKPEAYRDFERLCELDRDYREAALTHMSSKHTVAPQELEALRVRVIDKPSSKPSYTRVMLEKEDSRLELEVRRSFPCVDGVIETLQEIPVAKVTKPLMGDDYGFGLFLRHFIIKKLEDAFISQGVYRYAHVPRPVGSERNAYFYVWAHGEARCPMVTLTKSNDRGIGLDNWDTFSTAFENAGIDMHSRIRVVNSLYQDRDECAKQIIIKQPHGELEPAYFTRMWKRVNLNQQSTPINLDHLTEYLDDQALLLSASLPAGRVRTMQLAARFLAGQLDSKEKLTHLISGINAYRVAALRHINHVGFGMPPEGFVDLGVKYSIFFTE